ncbi:hypothetical protein K2173_001360 [Erythroxylum novogranatense]|uniref:Uncharacterized protein n=1 Tax=Erythroxylum novogranatense TaxID=1862640 RepID=A0AAV8T4S0_9ROSI|nr:hypothetical protein K2173_001360 [Erythroxylum novogranatense]
MGKDRRVEEKGEDDERREEAIASISTLQPNFKVTRASNLQLSKLHELHKRRLKIKSKNYKKIKDAKDNSVHGQRKDLDEDSNPSTEDLGAPNLNRNDQNFFASQDIPKEYHAPKTRHKLHWGLDTKERWERKANM